MISSLHIQRLSERFPVMDDLPNMEIFQRYLISNTLQRFHIGVKLKKNLGYLYAVPKVSLCHCMSRSKWGHNL